jgi:ComF family protein
MLKAVLDLVIPHRCFGCEDLSDSSVCPRCISDLVLVKDKFCLTCGKPTSEIVDHCRDCKNKHMYFNSARSLFTYEGKAENIIKGFKYEGGRFIPKEILNAHLKILDMDMFNCDLISYIPSGVIKYLKRGYNPAEEIARTMAEMTANLCTGTLIFNQPISDQTNLNKKERARNLKSAFKVVKKVKGLSVLLVDDVYTTGSTVGQASLALKKAGAKEVNVFTLARRL